MKKAASVCILFIISLCSYAQEGIPYISYFDENTDIEVQNWSVCQDDDNMMIFANRRGLLTYDGYSWDLIQLQHIPVIIRRCPLNNKIYMGSSDSYGFLEKKPGGRYDYFSISGDTANPGLITNIIFTDTTVIYYSEKSISVHRLDNPFDFKRWYADPGSPFTGMIAHLGKLFFNVKGKGLFRIESDTLFPIVTGYLTENREILFSLPFDDGKKLVGTDDNRLQLFDRILYYDYEISRPEYLRENVLSDAVFISDSLLALSTLYGGILVVNRETGDEVALLNYQNGLPDDEIYAMNTDNNDGLWLTHGYGICRVDFNLPVSSYSYYPGLEGVVTTVLFHNNRLYAGTNLGLFYLDQVREYDKKEVLYRIPPSSKKKQEEVPAGLEVEEKLQAEEGEGRRGEGGILPGKPVRRFLNMLFGSEEEPAEEAAKEAAEKETRPAESVEKTNEQEPAYDTRTVSVLKSINYVYRKVEGVDNRIRQVLPAGKGILALSSSGLHYVEDSTAGLILDNRLLNSVAKLDDDRFIICSTGGVSSLVRNSGKSTAGNSNSTEGRGRSTTEEGNSTADNFPANKGVWEAGKVLEGIEGPVYNAIAQERSVCWLGKVNGVLKIEGSWDRADFEIREYTFPHDYPVEYRVAAANDSIFAFAESGILVYSPAEDAFIPYQHPGRKITGDKKYKHLLSEAEAPLILTDDGWKFLGTGLPYIEKAESIMRLFDEPAYLSIDKRGSVWLADNNNNIYRIEAGRKDALETEFNIYISGVRSDQRSFHEFDDLVFEPGEKFITVSISAPFYLKETSTRYQYLVEGDMKNWSDWSISPEINISRESGDYRVHFRAMNILGEISEEKTISFSIEPPFTRSAIFYILIGLLVMGLFVLVIFVREKKLKYDKKVLEEKVRQRTLEIEQKKQQIEIQRDEIMHQKEEITSSIAYASRIQTAMLSGSQFFKNSFRDYFIMFKPRDIVSGDFYWIAGNKDRVYFTAADCTGHGVPGAFMSMLGISLLNEITTDGEKDFKPSEILELMRSRVITSLSHTSLEQKAVDGIDLAFCKYDRKKKILEYAGAFNPLYHFRKGELTEYKADRMPVGSYTPRARNFTNNELEIKTGDVIYIFSDGFTDQFGGPENKKYSTRRFKQSLAEVVELPMKKQYELLEEKFGEWKGETSQLDDVILIGIRF